jgi:predicted nucleic acid-binding protein
MILLDTNVVVDSFERREPFCNYTDKILICALKKEIDCIITANSLTDIFYLYSKVAGIAKAREGLNYLLDHFAVAAIDGEDCKSAMKLPIADFEDALIVQCALKYKVDCIITRDIELHKNGLVKALPPEEFLNTI